MNNEIVLATSIKAVSSALGAILTRYRATRATNRAELERLRDSIAAARASAHASQLGLLFRQNIDEITLTQQRIESHGLKGEALTMAMDHLRLLHELLIQNTREFSRG